MMYVLLSSNNVSIDLIRAVEGAMAGDIIMTETIPIYNKVLRELSRLKPDTMVYVRMLNVNYFPAVGAEEICGPDTDPILYPPDGIGTDGP